MPDAATVMHQTQGLYRRRVGGILVTALLDGQIDLSLDYVAGIDRAEAGALHAAGFRPEPPPVTISAFLVQSAGQTVLIDSGGGTACGPAAGNVGAALAAAGVMPPQVDTVLLTHAHIDHVSGLVNAAGQAIFPKARVKLHTDEAGLWLNDAAMDAAPDTAKGAFASARAGLEPYAARTELFTEGAVAPGITAIHAPGHTPGHTAYMIADGDDRLLIWGDVVHFPAIQFDRPEAALVFDSDTEWPARRARKSSRWPRRNVWRWRGCISIFPPSAMSPAPAPRIASLRSPGCRSSDGRSRSSSRPRSRSCTWAWAWAWARP